MLAVIAVCAFTAISLQTAVFIFAVMVVAGGISMLYLLLILATRRCFACGRHRLSALRLSPRCPCGHDLLRIFMSGRGKAMRITFRLAIPRCANDAWDC
ncbi:hypothetical protein [Caballeronia cordobensis]|uniref:hypothetical protein n=1 Tax=Caballeronia cordobensis TaxID=1353886 RepID=UPI00059FA8C0|nr:hypothetical protein [Caballeronia cordobensis]